MRCIPAVVFALLVIVARSQIAFSQQPMSHGEWTYKDGKPVSVTFVYGTVLTVREIDQLSGFTSLNRIVMGYAGIDSEYVEIEGDLWKLGRLRNLEELHLCVDALNDDDLKFVSKLPKLRTLEFNADSADENIPTCTDRSAEHMRAAKSLRNLVIHNGTFSDKFIEILAQDLPNLEKLSMNSAKLTDESLRILADRCKKLKSLSITSDNFTTKGLKHLDKLQNLEHRSVSSPSLRKKK